MRIQGNLAMRGAPLSVLGALAGRISWRTYTLFGILAVVWISLGILTNGLFLSARNLSVLGLQFLTVALLSLGMMFIIVSGNIDLSPGSAVYFLAVIGTQLQVERGWPTIPVVLVMLLGGLLIGTVNGLCVRWLRVPAFIATMASMLYLRGVALVIAGGLNMAGMRDSFTAIANGVLPPGWTAGVVIFSCTLFVLWQVRGRIREARTGLIPRPFGSVAVRVLLAIGTALVALWLYTDGLPIPVLFLALVAGLWMYMARNTKFGRHVYAIGGNPEACRLAGIDIGRTVLLVFVIMGLLYGLASVYLTARLSGAPFQMSVFMELDVIAACVMGGTSLAGGRGTVMGAIVGALLMESLTNGMSLMGLTGFWQYVSRGAILLIAVWIDQALSAKVERVKV